MSAQAGKGALPHRIRRVVFELRLPDEGAAFRTRGQLEETLEAEVIPALGRVLDAYGNPEVVHRLGRVVVELGELPPGGLVRGTRLAALVGTALARAFAEYPAGDVGADPPSRSVEASLSGFLRTGVLAWPSPFRSLDTLEEALLDLPTDEGERLAGRIRPQLRAPGQALRFAEQLSPALVRRFVRWLQVGRDSASELPMERRSVRERGAALRAAAAAPGRSTEALPTAAGEVPGREEEGVGVPGPAEGRGGALRRPGGSDQGPGRRAVTEHTSERPDASTEAAMEVVGAGIVLLHPFLPSFFHRVGMLGDADARFATGGEAARAVHLLHHLVTGDEHPEEPATALYKLLAGVPRAEPIPRWMPLDEAERLESTELLRAAIGHWSSLGSTSPAGLREGFLMREGRLVEASEGWELVVERRSVDVLLASIPWSLSVVRLPWMPRPLLVNWA